MHNKKNNYGKLPTLSAEVKRERAREYWRRWKERHAIKSFSKYGWDVDFKHQMQGWQWMATKQTNGAVLESEYFATLGKAKQDFYEAVEE